MKDKIKQHIAILSGIITIAAILRVFALDTFPPELFGDEIDVGYHAYSLLHTARDYTGQFLPTYIHSFSEWRAPLLMYATVPFVALFGLNEWGVRLTPAFFGVVTVLLTYVFVLLLTKRKAVALSAALLLAISPWHIQFSRTAYEVTLLMSLLLAGIIGFLKSFANARWFVVTAIAFGLMFYTYSTATLFIPLFLASLILIYWQEIKKIRTTHLLLAAAAFAIIVLPYVLQTVQGRTGERFTKISIVNSPQLVNNIETQRNVIVFPPNSPFQGSVKNFSEKISHNRPLSLSSAFITNYLQTFSTEFLFLSGDPNPRHSVGSMGELYLFFLPLLAIGVCVVIRGNTKTGLLILFLLLLTPVPSALTNQGGTQATRLFLFNLPIVVIAAFGLTKFFDAARKQTAVGTLFAVFFLFASFTILLYLHGYYQHNPVVGYKFWQYGYKDSFSYLKENFDTFDRILISNRGNPAIGRAIFHFQYDPAIFQNQFTGDRPKPNILPGFDGFSVGKLYFVELNDYGKKVGINNLIDPTTAYFITQEYEVGGDWDWRKDPPTGIKALHTTLDPWGLPLFYVITKELPPPSLPLKERGRS